MKTHLLYWEQGLIGGTLCTYAYFSGVLIVLSFLCDITKHNPNFAQTYNSDYLLCLIINWSLQFKPWLLAWKSYTNLYIYIETLFGMLEFSCLSPFLINSNLLNSLYNLIRVMVVFEVLLMELVHDTLISRANDVHSWKKSYNIQHSWKKSYNIQH